MTNDRLKLVERLQKNEITEYHVYSNIAGFIPDDENRAVLIKIAKQELDHYNAWKSISKKEIQPNKLRIFWYTLLGRLLGYTFVLKKMEGGEIHAAEHYRTIGEEFPIALKIAEEEVDHEQKLISLLNEEKLNYIGSMVLGLNDALVELTGTIAGLTFAM